MLVINDNQTQLAVHAMFQRVVELEKQIQKYADVYDRLQYAVREDKSSKYVDAVLEHCGELDAQMDLDALITLYKAHKRGVDTLTNWQNDMYHITKLQLEDACDPKQFYFVRYTRAVDSIDDHAWVDPARDAEILLGKVEWCLNGGLINHGDVDSPNWAIHT